MTARRTRGSGSIRRGKTGYSVRYRDESGQQVSGPRIFATKAEANLWLADRQAQIARGNWIDPRRSAISLREYGLEWLSTKAYTPKSREAADRMWRLHIDPVLGGVALGKITPAMVRQWYFDLGQRTGPAMLRNTHNLLKAILAEAVRDEVIQRNPVQIKGANRQPGKKRPLMSREQAEAIATQIAPHLRVVVMTAWWTSARLGEVLALRWQDVDLEGAKVQIHRQVVYVCGELLETEPKAHSDRFVDLPVTAVELLRVHKSALGKVLPSARVFTARDGHQLTPHAVNQAWGRARVKAGLAQFRFHDLRHGSATLAAQRGATTYEVMERLGHRTMHAAITYQHAARERGPQIAAAMAEAPEEEVS